MHLKHDINCFKNKINSSYDYKYQKTAYETFDFKTYFSLKTIDPGKEGINQENVSLNKA